MGDEKAKEIFARGFLRMGSKALAAGMLKATKMETQQQKGQDQKPYPSKNDRSVSAPGPGNPSLDQQNPDSFFPVHD